MTMCCSRSPLWWNTVGLCEVQSRIYVVNRWKYYPDYFPDPLALSELVKAARARIIQTHLSRNTACCNLWRMQASANECTSKCTHTVVSIHLEQWAANAAAPGEQLGVRCLAQGHLSHGIEGGESAVHSQSPPSIPAGPEILTHNLWITSLTL